MTGKPFHKTRTIISEKVLSSRIDSRDLEASAASFKNDVSNSINTPRLNINMAIKSLGSGIGAQKKPTYENTDDKTRTNSGGEPGMEVTPTGYRYQPKAKNGPGKKLVLFPSLASRESNGKTSNFGWLDKENTSDIKKYIEYQKQKPQIRIRKFKVNPKTDEIIPGSEIEMSPFGKNDDDAISEKMLPGSTVGSRGVSLLGRAAGKFGVVRDALNKFRCPPGTPAANQFTDHMGSNCFGQSAGDLIDFAIDAFRAVNKAVTEPNSRETLAKFFKEAAYDADNGRFGSFFARTMWRDADGNKIRNLRKWNSVLRDGEHKIFAEGMANGQIELEAQDNRIANLRDLLGVVSTPETRKNNDDVHEIFRILKERGMLNVTLGSPDPKEEGQGQRPTPEQVSQVVEARLRAVPGFNELSREQQKKVIANDIERFYETERALLEGFLDEYVKNPEHMGTIKNIVYEYKTSKVRQDEANFNVDIINNQAIGVIGIDIPFIMHSQETMLPQLADNERLRIDVVGAKTDSEAAKHLGDFLLTAAGYSKQHAATVEERGFARHIMKHEIAHSIQARAFLDEAKRQINEKGFISIGDKKIESIDDLTGGDLLTLMGDSADSVNLEALNRALSRTNSIMFMAGEYPQQSDFADSDESKVLEATAELWALRASGLIWGDDVDAALEWMDNIADGKTGEKRVRSDIETMKVIQDSYYLSPGESSAPWYVPEDPVATAAAKKRAENKALKIAVEKLDHDTIIDELAQLEFRKDEISLKIEAGKTKGEDVSDLEKEFLELNSIEKIIRSVWKKKYGTGSEDAAALKLLVKDRREKHSAFTPDVLESKIRAKKIMAAKVDAASIDDLDELIEMMAAYDLDIRLSADDKVKGLKREERRMYLNRYRAILEKSGDSRTWVKQKREMEEKIDKILRPTKTSVLRKPDNPSTDKKATDMANKNRNNLLNDATPRQRIAVTEFSDSDTSPVAQLLNPEKRDLALSGMKERNQRLKKLGETIDPTSRSQASPEEQVENILIPTMEIIDKSKIGMSLEMEAEIEIDVNPVTGEIAMGDVAHDTFISGRVLSKKNPATDNPKSRPSVDGKQKRRVIIQTTEEDRGIFPHWSMDVDKDDKRAQKLVIPPGKLKVVEVREDGTVVMQISEQKDTESVLDSLSNADIKGTRLRPVADRYITERRNNKIPRAQRRPLKSVETEDRGIIATREIKKMGGHFGEGIDDDVDDIKLSSGLEMTRSQIRTERVKSEKENLKDVKNVLTGQEPTKFKSLSRDSLDPEVAELIIGAEPEEIIKLIEDSAVEMHNSMDKRTRVRMRESELNNLASTGQHNPRSSQQTASRLQSGTQPTTGNRLQRRRARKAYKLEAEQVAAAQGARDEFRKLKDANLGKGELHKLDDATLLKNHNLKRSGQKSVISDNPIYMTNSAEQAIALMALGYEVEVAYKAERKMVKNAAIQTEIELKIVAGLEADDLGLTGSEKDKYVKKFMDDHDIDLCSLYSPKKNMFCSKNIGVKRENMPQSGGPTKGANSPAMKALIGGHIEGDFVDNYKISKQDRDRLKDIRKRLKKPDKNNPVSEDDRNWAAPYEDTIGRYSDISKILGSGDPDKVKAVSQEDRDFVFANTNWAKTETKTEPQLIKFLRNILPDGENSVVKKSKKPDELYASQKQLKHFQIDGQAEGILKEYLESAKTWGEVGTPEFEEKRAKFLEKAWFQTPILTSRDGYVVDGHHRWAAIAMINDHLPAGHPKIEVQVNEVQTSIFQALELAKVFQEHMGIKGKTVGKDPFPYEVGDTKPMSKIEFDEHMKDVQDNIKEYGQNIKDKGLYPVKVGNLEQSSEPRSPGIKDSRDRSVKVYGMEWKPEYSQNEKLEASKKWDKWDDVPLIEIDLSSEIRPTESHLKGSAIDGVVSGDVPFREGYHPHIVIDVDGKMYVSDGHNRVAMNRALGNEKIQARVVDLRKVDAPWEAADPSNKPYKGYDLVDPPNPLPKDGTYPVEIVEAAKQQREKIEKVEKEITATLIDLAEKHDSILIGLKHRLKSIKSLSRKINDEKGERSVTEAAEEMSDVVRYTATFSPENYVAGAAGVVKDLEKSGYKLTVKNYWEAGDPYQGINVAAVHPNGTRFELQFHTPQSAIDKEAIHEVYDEYKIATNPKKRYELYNRMVRMAERIEIPADKDKLYEIGETRVQEFSPTRTKSANINQSIRCMTRSINSKLITRASGQIVDAAMKRVGASSEIREKVNSAIILLSSYQNDPLSYFAKNVMKNSGPTVAEMLVKTLAAKHRIPLENVNDALKVINSNTAKINNLDKKNLELVFKIALNAFIEVENLTTAKEIPYEVKSADNKLEFGQRVMIRNGSAASNYLSEYEAEIGIPRDAPDSLRPVSGYVVNKSHIEEKKRRVQKSGSGNYGTDAIFEIQDKDIIGDGLTASGEIEVVLRPETANRVAYGRGNSFDTKHRPVLLNSMNRDDIVSAITVNNGNDKDEKNLDAMLHLLGSSKDKNFSHVNGRRDMNGRMKPVGKIDPSEDREHEVFEANILGGFSKDEVEGIHYPYSKVVKLAENEDISDVINFKLVEPRLQKLGFTSDEIEYFSSTFQHLPINTPSTQKLKEYRTAKKIKKKYESLGIGYVKFAHPNGVNIENPKSYSKTANFRDDPEKVIKQNIASEIEKSLTDMLKKIRKNKTRELVGDNQ